MFAKKATVLTKNRMTDDKSFAKLKKNFPNIFLKKAVL